MEELFALSTQTISTCTSCGRKETRGTDNYEVLLPCEDNIDAAFEKYFATENLSEVECSSKKCKCSKQTERYVKHLNQGPDILLTQMNRFQPDNDRVYKKNDQRVSYDEILDLSRYVKKEVSLKYRLVAVVLHWGTLDAGYYKTIGKTSGGQWATYDNEEVRQSSLEEALSFSDSEFTPYLLFWQKEPLETAQPPSSTSKKRTRQDDQEAPGENGRSSHKSPRQGTPPTSARSRHLPFSRIWPVSWLFGGDAYRKAAEKKLAECEDIHNLKDVEIDRLTGDNDTLKKENKELKKLIHRAANAHIQLLYSTRQLSPGLAASQHTTDVLKPFMYRCSTREKHSKEVDSFRNNHKIVKKCVKRHKRLAKGSEMHKKLVQILENAQGTSTDDLAKWKLARIPKAEDGDIVDWFDKELKGGGSI